MANNVIPLMFSLVAPVGNHVYQKASGGSQAENPLETTDAFGTAPLWGHEQRGSAHLVMPLFPGEMMFALIIMMTVGPNEAPKLR